MESKTNDKPAQPQAERPAWLPKKFSTVEQLAQSYTHLERKMGRKGFEEGQRHKGSSVEPEQESESAPVREALPPTLDPETDPEDSGLTIEAGEPEEAPAAPVVDPLARIRAAMKKASAGQMDEETLAALADIDVGPEQLRIIQDGTAARQQLEAQRFENEVLDGIEGGREAFNEATAWASENLTEAEQAAFNKATSLGDPGVARLAIEGLMARAAKADGPRLISGRRISGDFGDVFTSSAQMVAAQSDRRYATDPAYRAEVEAKILRSDFGKFHS